MAYCAIPVVDRLVAPASTADRLLQGDTAAAAELASRLVIPEKDNLVERPWGGTRLRAFKGLPAQGRGPRRGRAAVGPV